MNINYEYYRIFYYVAKYHSLTQAATMLYSNQPNVTRTIKKLENALGCILFVRSHQGVSLTPEGEKLFKHVRIAFEQLEAGEEELALAKSLQQGTISIGASEVALHCLLLPILKEYRQLYPGIKIRVTNHSTPQAITALKSGLVDIAVITSPLENSQSLAIIPIKELQEIPVCGSAFSYLTNRKLSINDLAEFPIICLGEYTKTHEFYSNLFLKYGINFTPSIEAATADQILPLVRNDLGIGFVPEAFLKNTSPNNNLHVLKLTEPIPPRNICLVKRKDFPLNIAARKLEEMIRNN